MPLWLTYDNRDEGAKDLAKDLTMAFIDAKWKVLSEDPARIPLKPGLFLFAAGDATPAYDALLAALGNAGYSIRSGTQYRAFTEERGRAIPNFQGLEFGEHQDYVLAIGRKP